MTLILFVIIVIMGVFMADLHRRLSRLEQDQRQEKRRDRLAGEAAANPFAQSARVISRPVAAAPPEPEPVHAPDDLDGTSEVLPVPEQVQAFAVPTPAETISASVAEEVESEAEPAETASPSEMEDVAQFNAHRARREQPAEPRTMSSSFEDLFGRKLPIWGGGVTLLVAAVLLVKYSIEAGLLSPSVRVMLAALFGTVLIGAAELARRMERFVQDDRIAQSLAGAGVGALYAATLSAYNLYHLISPGVAFGGFCAITALAMGLSIRFGAPCAVLALLGGLATPALVSTGSGNVPLLCGYLAMVIGSLTVLSRRQRWFWLGVTALTGGMGWAAIMMIIGVLTEMSVLTLGLLLLFLGIALPMLNGGEARGQILRVVGAIAAALQMAVLVSVGGYDAMSWGLYGLLSLAFLWLSSREVSLRPMIIVPMLTSLLLSWLWPDPAALLFTAVIAGMVLIFGGSALWRLWRDGGSVSDAGQIAAVAVSGYFLSIARFDAVYPDSLFSLLGLSFALLPAIGAGLGWYREERHADRRFPVLVLVSAFLVMIAGIYPPLPLGWSLPVVPILVSAGLLAIAGLSKDRRVSHGGLVYLGFGLLLLIGTSVVRDAAAPLFGTSAAPISLPALLSWSVAALITGAYGWRYVRSVAGGMLTGIAAALAYGAIAQIVPSAWLAIVTAAATLGVAFIARRKLADELMPALGTLGLIVLGWMVLPLGVWLIHGLASFSGAPMFAADVPSVDVALRRLLIPALLGGASLWLLRDKLKSSAGLVGTAIVAIPVLVALHGLYKLLFALNSGDLFIALGLAERTVWQALLIGTGLALWRLAKRRDLALAVIAVGLAHNLVYSLLLHNPLWSQQAVGGWPIVNLLLPAFGIAFAAPLLLGWVAPAFRSHIARFEAPAQMIVMLLFAFASLRQLFIGSVFALAPVEQQESIFWSVLAIAIAIGWLLWGIRQSTRSWRIGSLVLMLVAIAKVFFVDASGLEGLLRVASFLALGFSLIGIGWLYSRFLRADPV